MQYNAGSYDVAVIGAGHAGCEAALAAARLGLKTIIFCISMDAIANMPCNPSIGGTAKGHLVKEIDALGGEMGKAADYSMIQSRMLNKGKGPAVHSLRAQCDRKKYHEYMKKTLEHQDNLDIKQSEIVDIRLDKNNQVKEIISDLGGVFKVKSVIICTGTYLCGRIFVGNQTYESGPDGLHSAKKLSENIKKLGINLRRFKTGTPARISKKSIDLDKLEVQNGDEIIIAFSEDTDFELKNKEKCYMAYTNLETHEVIKNNIKKSAVYSGLTEGIGPRYCPSIEDKIVRFADKERHQLFIEPMGLDTDEMYLQGMSTSFPEEIQVKMYQTIKGFENVKIMRNAYAIEYDCCDPTELLPTLMFKKIKGLFSAGQFNGTSGYEEAAAQGLIAGINAVKYIKQQESFILSRSSSYIGTLIDDLVTKGCSEPYRMMTSRSEYRLILRQDNASERLTPIGYALGLISDTRYNKFNKKLKLKTDEIKYLKQTVIAPSEKINKYLKSLGTSEINSGVRAFEILKRPEVLYKDLKYLGVETHILDQENQDIIEKIEIETKYEGYIKKQCERVEKIKKLEEKLLPEDIDYNNITGLRLEAREKLSKIRPVSLGQASRISGVSPADISVLLIYITRLDLKK
ncbi:MAG: tRNA uridine-5-carboxymethylaminomethyl(34) synthesis enzyme MnmG [Oscillospiraceae bacterium]|nr:tRNA uridine-5-carboxymethylaminomethyl(34) synthesis enzyme MnmG [Oscillospiraceae bacterium]